MKVVKNHHRSQSAATPTSIVVANAILLAVAVTALAFAATPSGAAGSTAANEPTTAAAATTIAAEPIAWSFGGWNPLDRAMRANNSLLAARALGKTAIADEERHHLTTPLIPMNKQPSNTSIIASRADERQLQFTAGARAASASLQQAGDSSADNLHYVSAPQARMGPQLQQHHQQQSAPYAVAQFSPEFSTPSYSPPAPPPVLRDLNQPRTRMVAAPQQQQSIHPSDQQRYNEQQQYLMQMHMQMQRQRHQNLPNMMRHNQQQHPGAGNLPIGTVPLRAMEHQHFQREHQLRMAQHRDHLMRHHKQVQALHLRAQQQLNLHPAQQLRGNHMQQQQYQQQAGASNWFPLNAVVHDQQQRTAKAGAGFRVIEGGQPVLFNVPLEEPPQPPPQPQYSQQLQVKPGPSEQQQQQEVLAAAGDPQQLPPHPSSGAIETGLNFQNVLAQVDEPRAPSQQDQQQEYEQQHEARPVVNNIQNVKQQLQWQNNNNGSSTNDLKHQHQHHQQQNYLTIPVAVETEGDKVLTVDDINEIEKQVINVLPNLKSTDKVVKLADAHLTLASIKAAAEKGQHLTNQQHHQQQHVSPPAEHQANYREHKSTIKQLELGQNSTPTRPEAGLTTPFEGPTTKAAAQATRTTMPAISTSSSHRPQQYGSSASAPRVEHQQPGRSIRTNVFQQQQPDHEQYLNDVEPQQYFGAEQERDYNNAMHGLANDKQESGPNAGVGNQHPNQSEFQMIKNDILQSIRYEPTRASNRQNQNSGQHQQTGSTPPMPMQTSMRYKTHNSYQPQASYGRLSPHPHGLQPTGRPGSVTRYFQHGRPQHKQHHQTNDNNNNKYQHGGMQQDAMPTTRTILGGRKVSEVMRPLIRTTPVPMSSPAHVPSVDPEKLEAIQLIAGQQANDRQPVVVEPHQLVNHTPDGGIDYNSGAPLNGAVTPPMHQHQPQQQQYNNISQSTPITYEQPTTIIYHGNPQSNEQHIPNDMSYNHVNEQQHDAHAHMPKVQDQKHQQSPGVAEYVAEFSVNQQRQTANTNNPNEPTQTYEVAGQPELGTLYMPVAGEPTSEPYSSTNGGLTSPASDNQAHSTRTPASPNFYGQQQQEQHQLGENGQQQQQQPSLAWSPSVASEHEQNQQQSLELTEYNVPIQPLEGMPATAGYNNFFQPTPPQNLYETNQPPQQQQAHQEAAPPGDNGNTNNNNNDNSNKRRSKAGGTAPNPDAQYDGQIDKSASQHDEADDGQANEFNQDQHQEGQLNQAMANGEPQPMANYGIQQQTTQSASPYQQQQQQQQPQQQQASTIASLPNNIEDAKQQQYNYVKLNHEAQQNHLAQQQAQHRMQLEGLKLNQQDDPNNNKHEDQHHPTYNNQQQTSTTPMSSNSNSNTNDNNYEQHQHQQSTTSLPPGEQQQNQQHQQDSNSQQHQVLVPAHHQQPDDGLPIIDQQSLIPNPNEEQTHYQFISEDDGASQQQRDENIDRQQGEHQHQQQQAGVYQVYQAYYAPRDHKPLPGYVRLSIDEFNDLFKDAEIQYVDRNSNNGLVAAQNLDINSLSEHSQQPRYNMSRDHHETTALQQQPEHQERNYQDQMGAASSDSHASIVVDGRSIPMEMRKLTTNATSLSSVVRNQQAKQQNSNDFNALSQHRIEQTVKKIISVKNSKQELVTKPVASQAATRTSKSQHLQRKQETTKAKEVLANQSNASDHKSKPALMMPKPKSAQELKEAKLKEEGSTKTTTSAESSKTKSLIKVRKIETSIQKKPADVKAAQKLIPNKQQISNVKQ